MQPIHCLGRLIAASIMLLASELYADVLITNVHIITDQAKVIGPTHIHLSEGRIQAIGDKIKAPAASVRIAGKGGYLTPGLIDSHVHLHGVPGESDAMPAPVRQAALAQIPRSYLYFGFTTVLDLISDDGPIGQWNAQPLAPTAYHCAGVPIPGGYPLAWLPKAQQLASPMARYYLYDPRQSALMAATAGSEQHKAEALVARIAQTGARCIKTFYETGFGRLKNVPVPSRKMMKALIAAAHKHQLPVFIHGNSLAAYDFALDVGADLLVHGPWHGVKSADQAKLVTLAQRLVASGLAVQPTMQVIFGEREMFNPDYFNAPQVQAAIPLSLRQWYQSNAGQWMVREVAQNFGDPNTPNLAQHARHAMAEPLAAVQAFTQVMAKHDGDLVFGSDTPSGPMYTQFAGVNGHAEIMRWAEQGITPKAVFLALTVRNAKLLGLSDELGSIAKGKRADLLLMRNNPLTAASAYDTIEWVIVKGEPVRRAELVAK